MSEVLKEREAIIAGAAIALGFSSPTASYLTGAVVYVDGGRTARHA